MLRALVFAFPVSVWFLVTAVSLAAQSFVSSPRGYLTREGNVFETTLGNTPNGRAMYLDGELRGTPMTMRGIDLRVEYYRLASHDAGGIRWVNAGRSWSSITLTMAECDYAKASKTFSRNPTTTPTVVFQAPTAWPTISSVALRPGRWGHTSGRLRFPFARPWSYGGRADLCLDFDFNGGTLANRSRWTGGYRDTAYLLDAYPTGTFSASPGEQYGRSLKQGGCIDSSNPVGWGGIGYAGLMAYSATYRDPSRRNKLELFLTARMVAPGKSVIHGVGFAGIPVGVPVPGVTCNQLHLAPGASFFVAGVADTSGFSVQRSTLIPYAPARVGLTFWGQAAWSDSTTGRLMLTSAFRSEVPEMPRSARRLCVWNGFAKGPDGTVMSESHLHNPLFRYAY